MTALEVRDVSFSHAHGRRRSLALATTHLELAAGATLAVVGRSGAGKSTLAEIVLGLRRPATGVVRVLGHLWTDPRHGPRRAHRRLVQGVPQDAAASFVPRVPVGTQISDAVRRLCRTTASDARARTGDAARLARLDAALLGRRPGELSGGQAQRAAIARAVALGPAVIVADEPTSALDAETTADVAASLLALAPARRTALLIVTHDPDLAARCDARIEIVKAVDPA
ncbi:ATP-binding cassette domain-containing protein [Microbacterium sp. SORGH_AS_0888]|uniref:ATP-binding cassette domain-containing protein n=1 Tax=Microbacterium sp. SORGH_AS_0888 TaxID=3041791 RepID=UPI0027859DDD|nr:ATP-binding cassette domain-containing protein [Microbacterium sp. SORGH_AS_0888]MDQ1128218.1 ABC-type dipeptide/oligopeptide/nickel transport system ATPase subunit [Microbacterium sp. SORGH_AS_0888]